MNLRLKIREAINALELVDGILADIEHGPILNFRSIKRRALAQALAVSGTRSGAAKLLGIGERTLYRWIEEFEDTEK